MEARTVNVELPDRQPFITVDLGDDRGMHWLCAPSGAWVARLIQASEFTTATIMSAVQGDTAQEQMDMLKNAGPEIAGLMGALIGRSWHHESLQLSTGKPERKGDWLGYGEEVYDELHTAGYTLSELGLLAVAIITQIVESNRITKEVSDKASFFFQMMVPSSSAVLNAASSIAVDKPSD